MTRGERNADFAVVLHAADPRTMPGTWIKDDKRPLAPLDRGARWRDNAHQRVIHRPRKRAPIEQKLGLETQHVRRFASVVLDAVVAALAQNVEQQNGSLPCIDPILNRAVRPQKWPLPESGRCIRRVFWCSL